MKNRKFRQLTICTVIALATALISPGAVASHDDDRKLRVKGWSAGKFVQFDNFSGFPAPGLVQFINDVSIEGVFEIAVGDIVRTGRYRFPHLLFATVEFPPPSEPPAPPTYVDGHLTGLMVWVFDQDGVTCEGPVSGEFDENGQNLVSRVKLQCDNGMRLRLKARDVEVVPGESVKSKISGKLILPRDDDW